MSNTESLKKIFESIIFASESPVTIKELSEVFPDIEKKEIRSALKSLERDWLDLNRSFSLENIAEGYQFRTKPAFSEHIVEFNKEIKKFRLSRAALEVLAIIAYKQPVTKVEVEKIRGVDCSGVVNVLLDKRFLEIKGRKDVPGKPFIYGTTDTFLETFSLKSLKDLPTLKEIEKINEDIEQTNIE